MLHTILNYINDVIRHIPWDAVWASGVISPLLMAIKKWRITKDVESLFTKGWFVYLTLLFMAFVTAAGNYLLHTPTSDPLIIAFQTGVLAFLAQPIYFFVLKPGIAAFKKQVEKAAELNLQLRSAVVDPAHPGIKVSYSTPNAAPAPKSIDIQEFNN